MAIVVLVDPPGWQGAVGGSRPFPNIGLAYLIPNLRRAGHEVTVLDANNETMSDEAFLSVLHESSPDTVGFSAKTSTIKAARDLSRLAKAEMPAVTTVVGGPHTTVACQNLRDDAAFDVVFVGEGEAAFPQLCEKLARGETVDDVPGVVGGASAAPLPPVVPLHTELDGLPYPEYDLFPKNVQDALRTNYPLVTSRGCVYGCTYCSVPLISGAKFRKRSPANVIDELKWARSHYGATAFEIIDDTFNFDIGRCKEICRELIASDLNMTWSCPNGVRADRVDQELATLMYESGCRSVMVGIESADPGILAAVHKGETLEQIAGGIREFQAAGIGVGGFFIIGLPGDSYSAEERAVEFARQMDLVAHFNMLVPYPGTKLWEWAQENAHFVQNLEDAVHFADTSSSARPVFETPDFPADERMRAYEMVHTRMRQFAMIIPSHLGWFSRHRRIISLLWKYDRAAVPGYMLGGLGSLLGKIWRRLSRAISASHKGG